MADPSRARHVHRIVRAWGLLFALGALLVYFLAVSIRHLTVVPPVFEDEPWFASIGFKLATDGVLGSDVFTGYYGMERRYYAIPPVAPILLAGAFKLTGFGLLQLRLEMVALGAITLALTYVIGRRLFGPAVGALAVAFLLLVRMDAVHRSAPTGVLFLDASRIGRYDMPVPVFGLLALLAYLAARDHRRDARHARARLLYGLAGVLAGLSSLSHLYGAFWVVALGALAIWDRGGWRSVVALGAGFALPWAPYAAYVLADFRNWAGQTSGWAPRFGLDDPTWYLRNVLREPFRYGPGGPPSLAWLPRPGFWAALVAIPAALVVLAWRARGDPNIRAVAVPAILIPALFALLITHKFRNYKVTFVPLFALAVAWGACALWRAAGSHPGRRRVPAASGWVRPAMLVVAALVAGEGLVRAGAVEQLAATTSPYGSYIARVRAHIPAGTRVLGLHNYWIGFEDTDYRSWWLALAQMDGAYHTPPLAADAVLRIIDPEVVLLDPRIRGYFDGPPDRKDSRPAQIKEWLRGWSVVAVVEDNTYGRMEIYRRSARSEEREVRKE